uniref:Ovo n=2 Tax=Anopheles gambiae TaxID=7165 RepID=A0A1S4H7H2_ANOGA
MNVAANRHIKEETSNEHHAGEGCDGEDGAGRDIGQGNDGEAVEEDRECQQQQQHQRSTRTIYSLNMNVCRLCLSEGHGHLQPVYYAQDSPDEILLQKILELTSVEITYAIDFPTSVCLECLAKLDEFTHFRRQCIENNEMLKLKYYELKAEAEAEDAQYCSKQELKDEEALQLAGVKQEEEFIQLERSAVIAEDEQNGAPVDEQVTYVEEEEPAGNEIIIGDGGQDEYGADEQPVAGTKIQYVSEDGTMTEYITAGAIVRREAGSPELEEPAGGVGEAPQEIYYTVGTDTYAIPAMGGTEAAGGGGYVPQVYADQTEIECTTIEDHLPEEYVEEVPAVTMTAPNMAPNSGTHPVLAASRGRHDRPFVCKHCKTSFKYEHNYDRHMKNHAKVLYRCGKCSKTFVKLRKCQQHFLKAHSSQRYECDICYRTYSLPTRLENHVIEMHSVNGMYRCDRCQGELFTTYLDFKAHRLRYHPRTEESTTVGTAGADTTPAIIKQTSFFDAVHMEHVLMSNNSCTSPGGGSPTPSSEEDQQQQQQQPAKELPPARGKRPSTGSGPATPRTRTRTNGHNNRAAKAQKLHATITTTPQSSAQHEVILIDDDEQHHQQQQQQQHQLEDSPLPNGGASTPTVHRELLQQIEESEANSLGPKMYTCDSCPKQFVHLNNLKAHIYAEHDNDKPFKCKVCPISFKTKEILVMHMLLHTQNNGTT